MSGITKDYAEALKKTETLLNMPRAVKGNMTEWAAGTVKDLKRTALDMKKTPAKLKRKTSALARSVGFKISLVGDKYKLEIGTGFGAAELARSAQKYARIQDVGGVTHPTVTPRMRGWAWAMFYKTGEGKYKGIALTKKKRLDVTILPSRWFTSNWERRLPVLKQFYLNDHQILRTAQRMTGATRAG